MKNLVLGIERMKIVSWFLFLATFIGVVTGTDGPCLENHETQIAAHHSSGSKSTDSNSAPSSDCPHEGFPCHSCHLGHCAFVVSVYSSGLMTQGQKILPPGYLATLPTSYPSSLFRPPIA